MNHYAPAGAFSRLQINLFNYPEKASAFIKFSIVSLQLWGTDLSHHHIPRAIFPYICAKYILTLFLSSHVSVLNSLLPS